jgi:CheY-like chemotaxis protein
MKILIIDNFKEDRELLIKYLLEVDYRKITIKKIDESDCLTDALKKIEENNYDAILMDLILPESIGVGNIITIQNTLKQINKIQPIIIVITAYENYSEGVKAYHLGIKDYLIKTEIFPKDIARSIKFAIQSYKKI